MSSFLITYSSTDGHTKKICERINKILNNGNPAKLLSLEDAKKLDILRKIMIYSSLVVAFFHKTFYLIDILYPLCLAPNPLLV